MSGRVRVRRPLYEEWRCHTAVADHASHRPGSNDRNGEVPDPVISQFEHIDERKEFMALETEDGGIRRD